MKKSYLFYLIILFCLFLFQFDIVAQCPMCKIATESNMQNGGTSGNGLNKGILYMFLAPYIIVGVIIYKWWKSNKADDEIVQKENDAVKWN